MTSPDESSYPPVFRQPIYPLVAAHGDLPAPPLPPVSHPTVDLPVLDLQALDPGALAAACRDWGIFRLVNHGIPPALCQRLHEESRRLLALPFEAKRARFGGPAATYFFGTPAVSLGVRNLNWVEGLHAPLGRPAPPPFSTGGDHDHDDSACLSLPKFRQRAWRKTRRGPVRSFFLSSAASMIKEHIGAQGPKFVTLFIGAHQCRHFAITSKT